MLTIRDLIDRVGVDNVRVQFLSRCIVKMRQAKRDTEITFATDQLTCGEVARENARMEGVIIWIPVEEFRRVQKEVCA